MKSRILCVPCAFLCVPCGKIFIMATTNEKTSEEQQFYLFIGTYAQKADDGLLVYRLNTTTLEADPVTAISGIENPTFFCFSADRSYLYVVSEVHGGGSVYAYHFDRETGKLNLLNEQPCEGDDPCYIYLDKTGQWLFVGNYGSGSISVFPIEKNGTIGKAIQVIEHHGSSINLPQQSQAHVHCTISSPDNRFLMATDLGMDKIFVYQLDDETGRLSPADQPQVDVTPGFGPRHITFSKNGEYVYVIHELGGAVSVFKNENGKLSEEQVISTLPADYNGRIWAAELELSPDDRYLYASNRDDLNDIVIFSVDQENGKLSYISRISSGGQTVRNFTLSPNGKCLVAGHKNGNEVTIFKRDTDTGRLTSTDHKIIVPHAVCLEMTAI